MKSKHSKESIDKTYQELAKIYSDEEIAESIVFPSALSDKDRMLASSEFSKIRMEKMKAFSEEDIIFGELYRMKYRIEDYLKADRFETYYSFPNQLKEYLRISKRSQTKFAQEIEYDKTKISKIINSKSPPNKEFVYRLEKHCENVISAATWYKLYLREIEKDIMDDVETRTTQYKYVNTSLSVGLAS